MAASMIRLGITLIGRKESEYIGKGTKLNNIAALTEFERDTRTGTEIFYSADLNPNSQFSKGLVAIDIDCPITWAMLMEMVKNADPSFEGCIVNSTLRGGHLIFKASEIETTKIKALLNLGIKAEYFTNSVSVLAPGKYIFFRIRKRF